MTELEPSESMHWMNVGTARRCDDRIDEALYAFAKAAALGADTADFYYNVALAHIGRDDYEAAYSLLKKALARRSERYGSSLPIRLLLLRDIAYRGGAGGARRMGSCYPPPHRR